MEKNFFPLYCLMLCVWPMLAGAAEIDSLLDRLDAVIKERPHYIEEKKNRLLELKLRLYPGLPAEPIPTRAQLVTGTTTTATV